MTVKEREKYKRPAFEGYVDSKDAWYWTRTQNLVKEEAKKTRKLVRINSLAFGIATVLISLAIAYRFREEVKE